MGHELATVNGRTAMMYVGEVPWHGLGTQLAAPATARETIAAAGLDYEVELAAMTTTEGIPVPHKRAVIRTDSKDVLGVVGNTYIPVQNWQAFNFLDAVVADGGLRYHTAGALRKGERIWLMAKLPGQIRVRGTDDVSDKYLLLSNSHDGSSALRVHYTSVRVVCANTLSLADRLGRGEGITIRHQGNLASKVRQAQDVLGLARRYFDDLAGQMDLLAQHKPSFDQVSAYFRNLVPDPEEGNKARAQNVRGELFRLFEEGKGQNMPGVWGTSWAALNAVTEYTDHLRPTRAKTEFDRAANRLESAWFGSGSVLKQKAFEAALAMASLN